jgi:hypothetical protein
MITRREPAIRHLTGVSTLSPDGAGVCCREHAIHYRYVSNRAQLDELIAEVTHLR